MASGFFGAGGALGFDTLAAKTVLKLREKHPAIKLILVLPCTTQAKRWSAEDVEEYERIKAQADKAVYTSQEYTKGCMFKRNRHLVDNSGVCICYLTRDTGGTAYTVRYARSKGLRIINLALSAPFQNVDFRRNGMSFFAGQHTGVIQPYTPHHLPA